MRAGRKFCFGIVWRKRGGAAQAFRFPPFVKCAKDGAPALCMVPARSKAWATRLGHPPKDAGITGPELKELSAAVEADGNHKLKENGPVVKWIKTAPQVLAGGVKMGAEVGKAVLTEMLMQYYGLK